MSSRTEPLRTKNRQRVFQKVVIPSAVGGWNARDSYDLMQPTDAVVLENFIPRGSYLEKRNGFVKKVTLANPAKTIFSYEIAANPKILAAVNGEILELDLGADSTTSLASGYTENQWQYCLYKDRIFAVNGVDTPFVYNGTTIGATGFTGSGLALADLVNVVQYANRLFFIERGTLKFWYTNTAGNITGTLESFDLSQYAKYGGELRVIDTWGQDDEQLVLITSMGEVFIYSGTNPADATSWYSRGKYLVPIPLGYRSSEQLSGDLMIITEIGVFPLSKILPLEGAYKSAAFTDKITNAFKELRGRFSSFGWEIKVYSKGDYLLINIPVNSLKYDQFVMDTSMGSWTKFIGQNAYCWENYDGKLYFAGRNGNIYQADEGTDDDGNNIVLYCQQAYSDFGTSEIKKFNELITIMASDFSPTLNIYFGVDFVVPNKAYLETIFSLTGSKWNTFKWNTTKWGSGVVPKQIRTLFIAELGYKGSIGIKISAKQGILQWYSSSVIFEVGQGLK